MIISKLHSKKNKYKNKGKNAQVAMEYLTIVGFVSFILVIVIGTAFIYTGSIQGKMESSQMTNCANKIISTAENIFYSGEPSKATITCYIPDNIKQIEILENSLFFTYSTNSGENKIAFSSNVPINGTLFLNPELNKIQITATGDHVEIVKI